MRLPNLLPGLLLIAAPMLYGAAPLPSVSPMHPRIYVRHDSTTVGSGITVSELRRRTSDPAFSRWRKPVSGSGITAAVERAARYLEEGSQADLDFVREFLKTHTYSYKAHDVSGYLAGAEMAMAYDWIHAGLSEADRTAILANIVTTADSSRDMVSHPEINHNYTYMALNTVAVCGLVLKGEPEPYNTRGEEYLALAQKTIEGAGMVLDTWNAREGAWAEGSHYTFHETLRNLIMMLQAYRTASDTDYFPRIQKQYGNLVAKAGLFLIGSTRPDLTFERTGDTSWSRALAGLTVPLTVEMIASGLTGDDAARMRSFGCDLQEAYGEKAVYSGFHWGMRMFIQPEAPVQPSYKTLPLGMRLGKDTYEQIVFRNGWGPDSTQVTIISGDHFTDHQHFDKGQFLIYRHGGLAVDSGAYDGMYKPKSHSNDYAVRTLAHNCLLVRDPGEILPKGYTNDGGQRILRGMQHHRDWLTYVDHRKREGLDSADVEAYAFEAGKYGYVRVNLKSAYSDKVVAYDRQFVYVPGPDYLVVFDRVSAAQPDFAKRWLLHFQDRPQVDGKAPEPGVTSYPGARVTIERRQGEIDLGARKVAYDGSLAVQTLLPLKREITVIGGPGFEFYNNFDKENYPLSRNDPAAVVRESGNWRIEVAPAEASKDDHFLHAFQIGTDTPVESVLVKDTEAKTVGVRFVSATENHVALFAAKQGTPAALPLRYELSSQSPSLYLISEMTPGQLVTIEVNGKILAKTKASDQGVVTFRDGGKGKRRIVVR